MTTPLTRLFSRSPLPLLALLGSLAACAHARADPAIYKCVDENGRVELTDINKRGCKQLDLPGTIAAPPAHRTAPVRALGAAAAASTPSAFPKVDSAQQRARDSDRRGILEDELRSEEKTLAQLRRDFNNGEPERNGNERNYVKYQERVAQMRDNIGRAEKNVEALKREIANIK